MLIVQSGLLCNRDPVVKKIIHSEEIYSLTKETPVNFLFDDRLNNNEYTKLIKIALYSNNLGSRVTSMKSKGVSAPIWVNKRQISEQQENLKILYSDERLEPWIMVKQKQ